MPPEAGPPGLQAITDALRAGRPQDAERLARAFLAGASRDEGGMTLLGFSLQRQGRAREAADVYQQLTRLLPGSAIHWNNLGTALREAGDSQAAERAYLRSLELEPRHVGTLLNFAYLYMERGIHGPARDLFLRAHTIDPGLIDARIYGAQMCYLLGDPDQAQRLLEPWRSWRGLSPALRLELAILLIQFGSVDDAMPFFEELMREDPGNHRARAQLVLACERVNRLDDARRLLAELPPADAIVDPALRADAINAHATLALRETDATRARALLEQLERNQAGKTAPDATLYFSLAKACERLGDTDAAMDALAKAHAAQLENARHAVPDLLKPDSQPLYIATLWINAEQRAAWPEFPAPASDRSPVFIVGFPRSGTTMLEQMLDAHPTLKSMDERAFLQNVVERMSDFRLRYPQDLHRLTAAQAEDLRALYWKLTARYAPLGAEQRLVDKNPLNMLRLPLINRLFPDAPIILALRHPCDVILSCYMQNFGSPAFAVLCSTLERLARGYVTAMDFWRHHAELLKPRVMDLRYEDLLADFPGYVERIGAFLELEDTAPMLDFHGHARGKGFIATPSYSQVIEPPHTKAVNRWHRYRKYLEPVLPVLEPVMRRWGYAG